ncbi:glycosyltransferase [Flavivirga algicola]|uniref:Glycosyltransferase family 2 protein n=1 Tax=Flavivirga algicola TaxID=2729136 RepID=A0ABX1RYY6_9FLAO|nr:glycosyltransferase [Flavivirga algicola]NMH88018.1 glycosyltransferase family 2 protein [Flavivirga algicola]
MLSILIPVYNYNITNLVYNIHEQATRTKIEFEIICFEDGSNKYVIENKSSIETLMHTSIIVSSLNKGSIKSRQILSNQASYNWLLFLDSDVIPKHNSFIEKYINLISPDTDALYGGVAYKDEQPETEYLLRWKYGKSCEEINASKRNRKPYQVVVSGNFLIKKTIFNLINLKIKKNSYGLDNYFGILLNEKKARVKHINNEVYHLGIDKSDIYIKKIENAIETLLWLLNERRIFQHNNKLLSIFIYLKRLKLNHFMSLFFRVFNTSIKKNLLGKQPNIFFLQLYKISYMCYKDLQ